MYLFGAGIKYKVYMACVSAQSCPTLCILVDCSPPGSSVHGISQARIQDWLAISYSRGSSQPKDGTHVSCISCIGRWVLYNSATWEAQQGINIKFLIVGKLKISFRLKRCCCSVSKSSLTLCKSHGLQHTCPSLSPRVCSNSCPLSL